MNNKGFDVLQSEMEPMKLNGFKCEISLNGTAVDWKVIDGFFEIYETKYCFVRIRACHWKDYEWLFTKALEERCYQDKKSIGKICFTNFTPDGNKSKIVEYNITDVNSIRYPQYDYQSDGVVTYDVRFKYDKREITYFRNADAQNERKSPETEKCNEKQEFDDYGFPIHRDEAPSFEFGDFNTALRWFENNLLDRGRGYNSVAKYDEVDKDIEDKTRPTVVIGSRQCGMTTHMLAWSLAKISTTPSTEIVYVGIKKEYVYENTRILRRFVNDIKSLKYSNLNSGFQIENTENNSRIYFISVQQNVKKFFVRRNVPDYVIYDDMAYMDNSNLNEFINTLDERENARGKFVKEICVSTPSKGGSIFNFIALVAKNPIEIPWNDGFAERDRKWAETFMELIGKDNFETELCCKLDTEGDFMTGDESWAIHFEQEPEDYQITSTGNPEADDYEWLEIKEKKCRKEKFDDDYGNQFPDEFPEDKNYNVCCGHGCC